MRHIALPDEPRFLLYLPAVKRLEIARGQAVIRNDILEVYARQVQYQRGGYACSVLAEEAVEHRRRVNARQLGKEARIVALALAQARHIYLGHSQLHMRRCGVYFEQREMIVVDSGLIFKLRRHGYRLGIAAQVEYVLYPVVAEELHVVRR